MGGGGARDCLAPAPGIAASGQGRVEGPLGVWEFRVLGVQGLGFRVFGVQGLGFRV